MKKIVLSKMAAASEVKLLEDLEEDLQQELIDLKMEAQPPLPSVSAPLTTSEEKIYDVQRPSTSSPESDNQAQEDNQAKTDNQAKPDNQVQPGTSKTAESKTSVKIEKPELPSPKKPFIMCKEFARGSCTRPFCGGGVYKFCKDFQNSKCVRQNCRYVHATVFEEHRYYRTSYLPPHIKRVQDKQSKIVLLPPPPPPPKACPVTTQDVSVFPDECVVI